VNKCDVEQITGHMRRLVVGDDDVENLAGADTSTCKATILHAKKHAGI
jgi:hypothetical protein